jgi:hypothetical protein
LGLPGRRSRRKHGQRWSVSLAPAGASHPNRILLHDQGRGSPPPWPEGDNPPHHRRTPCHAGHHSPHEPGSVRPGCSWWDSRNGRSPKKLSWRLRIHRIAGLEAGARRGGAAARDAPSSGWLKHPRSASRLSMWPKSCFGQRVTDLRYVSPNTGTEWYKHLGLW